MYSSTKLCGKKILKNSLGLVKWKYDFFHGPTQGYFCFWHGLLKFAHHKFNKNNLMNTHLTTND